MMSKNVWYIDGMSLWLITELGIKNNVVAKMVGWIISK